MPRRLALLPVVLAVVLLSAAPAWAHVTIAPDSAPKGGSDVEIAFRVPNEEAASPTTKVQVFFPSNPPFLSVLPRALPGWKASVVTTKLAKAMQTDDGPVTEVVTEADWTATAGGGVPVGEYQRFQVIVGQMPSTASSVTLKVLQTYANGNVVRWIEDPSGQNPAPVLTLTSGSGATTGTTPATTPTTGRAPATGTATKSQVDSAKALGTVGIIVGALGVIVAILALARKRAAAQ